jgi:hypothetical protein
MRCVECIRGAEISDEEPIKSELMQAIYDMVQRASAIVTALQALRKRITGGE